MTLTCVGRSFYTPDRPSPISGGAEVWLGYYQSLRATQAGLTLNVDMSAMAFVRSMPMVSLWFLFLFGKDRAGWIYILEGTVFFWGG